MLRVNARRAGSRLPIFSFVFALLLQGAVPLFASAAAALQGKSVGDICTVWGVVVPGRGGDAHARHAGHAGHDMAAMSASMAMAMSMSAPEPVHAPAPAPHRHEAGDHAGDHCVLSGLVAFAASSGGAAGTVPGPATDQHRGGISPAAPAGADAAARWAALLGHGPPTHS